MTFWPGEGGFLSEVQAPLLAAQRLTREDDGQCWQEPFCSGEPVGIVLCWKGRPWSVWLGGEEMAQTSDMPRPQDQKKKTGVWWAPRGMEGAGPHSRCLTVPPPGPCG